jgi:hypothetical protein
MVYVDYGEAQYLITKVESSHAVRPGDSVHIGFRSEGVMFFDSGIGERLLP